MKKIIAIFVFFCISITFAFAFDLRLTEVFVDWSDERFEVTNAGTDEFNGTFQVSGAKAALLSIWPIVISPMSTVLIGDNLSMLSTFDGLQVLAGRGLSLVDSNPVAMSLLYDGQEIDRFDIDQSSVQSSDNTNTSFQKSRNGSTFDISLTSLPFTIGVTPWFIANPGRVYQSDGLWRIWLFAIDTGGTTWNASTGSENTTWSLIDCAIAWTGVFVIDEIYHGEQYSDYIELLFLQDWYGSLLLSWDVVASSVTIPPQSYKANTRYIIASNSSGFLHNENIIISPYTIYSSGNLMIQDVSSFLMYHSNIDITWQSVYHTNTQWCIQYFTSHGIASPWFDEQFVWYLATNTITHTIVQTITGSCATWSIDTWSSSWSNFTGTALLSGLFSFQDVRISLIDYDPPWSDTNNERIWLTLMTWDMVDLSWWTLSYDGKTYKFLSWIMMSGTEYIRIANFTFVNSRSVCVSLLYKWLVIDTACYDPTQYTSPYLPLVSIETGSNMTWWSSISWSINYDDLQFDILSVLYDPDGSDTDRETVTFQFVWWSSGVDLSLFRLRVGTFNKRIYGTIASGQTMTLMWNYQMPNTKATCIAITYGEIIYDEYCYNPTSPVISSSPQPNLDTNILYQNRSITIQNILYDPDGNDTDRETVTLLMTWWQWSIDLSRLYLRFGTTKRYLSGALLSDSSTIVTGNYQLPNSKATCVDLMEGTHIFDTYCYDPLLQSMSWDIQTGQIMTWLLPIMNYSGLQLQRILPNPEWKDIKNTNEKFALFWWSGSGQMLTKNIKLVVWKTSISLSGYTFTDTELVVASPKALTNQAACARLLVDGREIDRICYPQTKEWLVYYHPRLNKWPQTIPSSLIESLDIQWLNLSDLILKRSWKQICLTYKTVKIRCMNSGTTSTTAKNRALLTLGNAYIRKMSDLVYDKKMDYVLMEQYRKSYRTLADTIKWWNLWSLIIHGRPIKVTDIEWYMTAVYEQTEEEYLVDQFARIFFWHQKVDTYYKELYTE